MHESQTWLSWVARKAKALNVWSVWSPRSVCHKKRRRHKNINFPGWYSACFGLWHWHHHNYYSHRMWDWWLYWAMSRSPKLTDYSVILYSEWKLPILRVVGSETTEAASHLVWAQLQHVWLQHVWKTQKMDHHSLSVILNIQCPFL